MKSTKHRLRHPIRAIREPFGTAGLIIACLALFAALGGTALAAKGALTGKQKKEVEKIAKKFAGKPGAPGTNGANGANGKDGTNGTNGSPGEPGEKGKSVQTTAIGPAGLEGHCVGSGGTRFQIEGSPTKEFICNGSNAPGGGFPETLPQGSTETGTVGGQVNAGLPEGNILAAITFAVPLEAALGTAAVHFVTEEEQTSNTAPSQCPGSADSPEAEEGNLCVYVGATFPVEEAGLEFWTIEPVSSLAGGGSEGEASTSGAFLKAHYELPTEEGAEFQGSWAVTG